MTISAFSAAFSGLSGRSVGQNLTAQLLQQFLLAIYQFSGNFNFHQDSALAPEALEANNFLAHYFSKR